MYSVSGGPASPRVFAAVGSIVCLSLPSTTKTARKAIVNPNNFDSQHGSIMAVHLSRYLENG